MPPVKTAIRTASRVITTPTPHLFSHAETCAHIRYPPGHAPAQRPGCGFALELGSLAGLLVAPAELDAVVLGADALGLGSDGDGLAEDGLGEADGLGDGEGLGELLGL